MADEPPPDLEELARALCDVLNVYDVSYILVGSLAARWRIENRPEGAKIDGSLEPRHFLGDPLAVGLTTRLGALDVVFRVDGFQGNAYEALSPRALTLTVQDVDVRVVAVDDIVTSKRAAGRRKDLDHLPILERFLAERERSSRDAELRPPTGDLRLEPDLAP